MAIVIAASRTSLCWRSTLTLSECRSVKRVLRAPSFHVAGLTHYLGLSPYDTGPELGLVETSCTAEVFNILKAEKMSTSFGCAVNK